MQNELHDWDTRMSQMTIEHEQQLNQIKKDIEEQYRNALQRSKQEAEHLQTVVQKYKK